MSQKVNVTQKHYRTYSKVRWAYSSGEGIINNFHNPSLLCHTKKLRFIQHCYLKSIYTWRDITSKAHYGKGKQEEEAQWSLKTHHSLSLSRTLAETSMWKSAHDHPLFIQEILYLLVWQMATVSPDWLTIYLQSCAMKHGYSKNEPYPYWMLLGTCTFGYLYSWGTSACVPQAYPNFSKKKKNFFHFFF